MTDEDRRVFAGVVDRVTRTWFSSNKRAAYRRAGVSPATWDRALDAHPLRADRYAAIVDALFPMAWGDWRMLDVFDGPVDTTRPMLETPPRPEESVPSFWDVLGQTVTTWGTHEGAIAEHAGLRAGSFEAWRRDGVPVLPDRRTLILLASAMHVDYEYLIKILLHEARYLPQEKAFEYELDPYPVEESWKDLLGSPSTSKDYGLAARRADEEPGLARQAAAQDAEAHAGDPDGPEGGA